ncbi:MAG: hypothetical protein ACM3X1_04475 [Ignavibacteriales bacterium]
MGLEINENVLLTIAGVIFVPIFVFLIKMIMEVANIRTKLDAFQAHIDETKAYIKKILDFDYEIRLIKTRLAEIEDDLKYLFSERSNNKIYDEKRGARRRFRATSTAERERREEEEEDRRRRNERDDQGDNDSGDT